MNEFDRLLAKYDKAKPLSLTYTASEIKTLANELDKSARALERQMDSWEAKRSLAKNPKEENRALAKIDEIEKVVVARRDLLNEINGRLNDWFAA